MNRHFNLKHDNLFHIDIISLNGIQCTRLFIVSTKYKDDRLFKKTAATLTSSYIELYTFINVPFILLNTVVLAASKLNFLGVLVATKRVNCLSTMGTDAWEKSLFLKHGGFRKNVLVDVLQAIIAHSSKQEPTANILMLGNVWIANSSSNDVD